tara:strand:+ start:1305 stop:2159 length:855 start_codon:yes stop_codon:yes gene_type:complete
MKYKHNKKRNTAFLFESLIREITKSVIAKDSNRKKAILSIVKEHFAKDTILFKELELYKALYKNDDLASGFAEKLLKEVKEEHKRLDSKKIFEAQSKLIRKINTKLTNRVFANFVPNYKNLATIQQIFNAKSLNPRARIILEQDYIKILSTQNLMKESKLKSVDKLTFKTFINKFNDRYSSGLLKEQKTLLKYHVTSFTDHGLELKIFLNEEIGRLKKELGKVILSEEVQSNQNILMKTERVLKIVESFRNREVDDKMIEIILKVQELVSEKTNNGKKEASNYN